MIFFDQSKMFFIIGIGRSGTSLLQAIMNTFQDFTNEFESMLGPAKINCYSPIIKFNDFSYLEKFIKENWNDGYFVEKTPYSILCLPQLHEKFPSANYIFLERHPLKIFLSQMNQCPPGEKEQLRRDHFTDVGIMEKEDELLNYEQFIAKGILKRVKAQTNNKSLFGNQITIKYEEFKKDLESQLILLKNKFNIQPNFDKAKKTFSEPARGSKRNQYDIKTISDPKAIEMINECCTLWKYDHIS